MAPQNQEIILVKRSQIVLAKICYTYCMNTKLPKTLTPYYIETTKAPKANNYNRGNIDTIGKLIEKNQEILSSLKINENSGNR